LKNQLYVKKITQPNTRLEIKTQSQIQQ